MSPEKPEDVDPAVVLEVAAAILNAADEELHDFKFMLGANTCISGLSTVITYVNIRLAKEIYNVNELDPRLREINVRLMKKLNRASVEAFEEVHALVASDN